VEFGIYFRLSEEPRKEFRQGNLNKGFQKKPLSIAYWLDWRRN
jgi:hypothetical protein